MLSGLQVVLNIAAVLFIIGGMVWGRDEETDYIDSRGDAVPRRLVSADLAS